MSKSSCVNRARMSAERGVVSECDTNCGGRAADSRSMEKCIHIRVADRDNGVVTARRDAQERVKVTVVNTRKQLANAG